MTACSLSRFSGLTTIRAHVPYIVPPSSSGPRAYAASTEGGTLHGLPFYHGRRMEERWFDVAGDGGVRLRAREIAGAANDAPAILLHHGLASSQRIWDLMLPGLARRFRVVTYDARGHGLSTKPSSGYGYDHVTADALAVIRAARMRRPVVVGHSWGADVALAIAADRPRAVGGAVLIDGGVFRMRSSFPTWGAAKPQLAPPLLAGTPLGAF